MIKIQIIATSLITLIDLAEMDANQAIRADAYCQFGIEEFQQIRYPLERKLLEVGFESLKFKNGHTITLENKLEKRG